MKIGDTIKIIGFRTASHFSDGHHARSEQEHINCYSGKFAKVISVDSDELHPIQVRLIGNMHDSLPAECRFNEQELNPVDASNNMDRLIG